MKNIRKYDKNNKHWWSHEKDTRWAVQDKDGHWWLVSGSEFPEKKVKERKRVMKCGMPPIFNFKTFLLRMFFAMLLGASLGLNIFLLFLL